MNKTIVITFIVGLVLGLFGGFFIGKGIYDKPIVENVTHDTVTLFKTIPDYTPQPKDSAHVKYLTKWLKRVEIDTALKIVEHHDTVAVEVPITSKHYGNETYDAWVSGFEPSLDSIKVYQKTEYITETITRMKPPNKFGLGVVCGIDHNIAQNKYEPYVFGEFMYKPNRFEIGIQGGVVKNDKVETVVGIKAKMNIL